MHGGILIWGAGAIGGTLGAYLVRAGQDVTFVDVVPEHVAAINQRGLSIEGPIDTFTVKAKAFLPADLKGTWKRVFLAVKAQHTADAARALKPHLADDGYVLSLQNGLCELIIQEHIGRNRTVGAFINYGSDWQEPGKVLYSNSGAFVVGELDGTITPRVRELYDVVRLFEPNAILADNIWSYLWGKLAYVSFLFAQGLGVRELLTSTSGFVGPRMAALYGVAPPASGVIERELGAQRVGYFSQIPFLSLYGLNNEPDAIHRGVTMNLGVLCALLGPPAANLPPIPALQPGQTNRQRISMLTEGCGGVCHKEMINPLGFAFEHFDGMGRYRDTENGNLPIVSSGSYMFTEGRRSFEGAADLMRSMADGKQAHQCYAKKLASFGLQRDIVDSDLPLLDALSKVSMDNGSIKRVVVALVRDDAFRLRSRGGQ